MKNPTMIIDDLELATNSATALVDIICQLHANGDDLPKHFDALGALVAGSLEEASAAAKQALRVTIMPPQSAEVIAGN